MPHEPPRTPSHCGCEGLRKAFVRERCLDAEIECLLSILCMRLFSTESLRLFFKRSWDPPRSASSTHTWQLGRAPRAHRRDLRTQLATHAEMKGPSFQCTTKHSGFVGLRLHHTDIALDGHLCKLHRWPCGCTRFSYLASQKLAETLMRTIVQLPSTSRKPAAIVSQEVEKTQARPWLKQVHELMCELGGGNLASFGIFLDVLELSLGEVIVAHPLTDHAWGAMVCRGGGGGGGTTYMHIYIYTCIHI